MDYRNATGSWSGYLHQGKVGLLVALQKINELISNKDKLDDWIIEYESAEDFDIKKGSEVSSRHQVKAYKDAKYPNDYRDVLGILKYENGKIKTKGFRICSFDKYDNPGEVEVDKESRFLHTIRHINGFNLSEKEFRIQCPKASFIENPNNIKLYEYPDGNNYCDFSIGNNKLTEFCKKEIKEILYFYKSDFKDDDIRHENILFELIDKLDIEIRKKHILGKDFYPTINFTDIFNLINSNEKYIKSNISQMRQHFSHTWDEFLEELSILGIDYDFEKEMRVENIISEIYKLDDNEFVQFLKNINPDENNIGDIESIRDVLKVFKVNNLKDIFYQCLLNVINVEFNLDCIGYKEDGGYLLTLIDRPSEKVKLVINGIINNSNVSNEIFERRYLINREISDASFEDIINSTAPNSDLRNSWGVALTKNDRFMNPDMELISLDRAIKQLNER